jgi:hypothetical protein
VLSDEVAKAVTAAGLAWAAVKRAKAREPICARRRPQAGTASTTWPWEWCVPDPRAAGPEEDPVPL